MMIEQVCDATEHPTCNDDKERHERREVFQDDIEEGSSASNRWSSLTNCAHRDATDALDLDKVSKNVARDSSNCDNNALAAVAV